MENKKAMYGLSILILLAVVLGIIFYLARIIINAPENYVHHNLSYKTIKEIKDATKPKNTYSIKTGQDGSKTYYLLEVKGIFHTEDIENLSFKSDDIPIENIPNYKDKILTVNNLSIVDLTFYLNTKPTKVTFNNKKIRDTNISIDDFNKVKDNIEKYKHKLIDVEDAERRQSIFNIFRFTTVMTIGPFLLPVGILCLFFTLSGYGRED